VLVVDSTVWIDYFNGRVTPQTDHLDRILPRQPILVGDLILAEVLQGFRSDAEFDRARRALREFTQVNVVNHDLAVESARNYRRLRRRGITLRKFIDCLIATYCIQTGHDLLHSDQDYDPFEKHLGLSVVHPLRRR
jgi:predicted nucleic acid-binding protein